MQAYIHTLHSCTHRAEPNTVVLHTRMLDSTAQLQQEALGVLGVNFIHSVLFHSGNPSGIIARLLDDLSRERIEVVRVKGVGGCVCVCVVVIARLVLTPKGCVVVVCCWCFTRGMVFCEQLDKHAG